MSRTLFFSLRHFIFILFLLPMLVLFSACGGSGGGSATPKVNLTVSLFDSNQGGSPSGNQVNIRDAAGEINFTCFQSAQPVDGSGNSIPTSTIDSRCEIGAASDSVGSGPDIIFNDLPTQKTYILAHADPAGNSGGSCTVEIQSTSTLVAQSPCADLGGNTIRMTINAGTIP